MECELWILQRYLHDKINTHQETISYEAQDAKMPCFHAILKHGWSQALRGVGTAATPQNILICWIGASQSNQGRASVENHQKSTRDTYGCAKDFDNAIFREDVDHLNTVECRHVLGIEHI
jgi:hypothetical protein